MFDPNSEFETLPQLTSSILIRFTAQLFRRTLEKIRKFNKRFQFNIAYIFKPPIQCRRIDIYCGTQLNYADIMLGHYLSQRILKLFDNIFHFFHYIKNKIETVKIDLLRQYILFLNIKTTATSFSALVVVFVVVRIYLAYPLPPFARIPCRRTCSSLPLLNRTLLRRAIHNPCGYIVIRSRAVRVWLLQLAVL